MLPPAHFCCLLVCVRARVRVCACVCAFVYERESVLAAAGGSHVFTQGVAHKATGEMANLPELASRSGSERAADEMAHTTFFPCLVLHSAHESLFGVDCN